MKVGFEVLSKERKASVHYSEVPLYKYKRKDHFYEMNVGMSCHEKKRNKKIHSPRQKARAVDLEE